MKIEWNKVNPLSELIAIILAAFILLLGIYMGMQYQRLMDQNEMIQLNSLQNKMDSNKNIMKGLPVTMTGMQMSTTPTTTATITPSTVSNKTTTTTPTVSPTAVMSPTHVVTTVPAK